MTSTCRNIRIHCFFEQSGTFKKEAQELGCESWDYDIKNDFGKTDYVCDLFKEIEEEYRGGRTTMFDFVKRDDYVLAFFPCIRFEKLAIWHFTGQAQQQKNWSLEKKLEYTMKLHDELNLYYKMVSKLVLIALRKGFKLIIENPYHKEHYLTRYWPLLPKFIEKDRHRYGDYYTKPTQFFFINCEPRFNILLEPERIYEKRHIENQRQVDRSMISPEYANRFLREMVLPMEEN